MVPEWVLAQGSEWVQAQASGWVQAQGPVRVLEPVWDSVLGWVWEPVPELVLGLALERDQVPEPAW